MLRNIIWDVDGTLFDTYPAMARALKTALNDLGGDASLDWIEELARKSLSHCVSTLADQFQLDEDDIVQAFGKHYSRVKPEEQPLSPGVIPVCQYVRSIEGKNVIVTHRGRDSLAQLLAANDITDYFAGCLTRDDGYPRKPDPTAFEAVLKTHNLKRDETIAVGDRDIDIEAGQAAGVCTCFLGPGPNVVGADLAVSDLHDLLRFLVSANKVPYPKESVAQSKTGSTSL